MKNVLSTIFLPLLFLISVNAQLSSAADESLKLSPSEISTLVEETGGRTTNMARRLFNYSYLQTDEELEIDKDGKVKKRKTAVYEVALVKVGNKSQRILVQISEDDVPFNPEKIERERERIAKRLLEDEEKAKTQEQRPAVSAGYTPKFWSYGIKVEKHSGLSKTFWYINPTVFFISHDFYAPRQAVLNNREMIVLNFRPRPGYKFDAGNVPFKDGIEDYGRVMSQLGGIVWIDAADKVIVRLEAFPVQELNSRNEASHLTTPNENAPLGFEFTRLPEGVWVPSRSWYNSYGRENVFWKTSISRSQKFGDFKLFKTTVKEENLGPAQTKP